MQQICTASLKSDFAVECYVLPPVEEPDLKELHGPFSEINSFNYK